MTRLQPSSQMVSAVIARSKGQCECRLQFCGHRGRCTEPLAADDEGSVTWVALTDDMNDQMNWIAVCPHCHETWRSVRGYDATGEPRRIGRPA